MNTLRILIGGIIAMLLTGCGSYMYQPVQNTKARLGEVTQLTTELQNIPETSEPVMVAVYQFRDQTGQYKPTENGSGFSTAVTQGATNILTKALEDSKWFVPVERENISDLLNERKIIRSSRQQFGNNEELPPLLFAGVIFEGGIVSYDANIITGGAGLRYFGAGASRQYRQDRVTVYLRAVSVSNGQVLKTVYTSKTVLSQAVNASLFRYVSFKRLLEVETGFTYNEPSEMAVTEAIEKAVEAMIVEGALGGLWSFKDKSEIEGEFVKKYLAEKENLPNTDILGRNLNDRRKRFNAEVSTSSLFYKGDFPDPTLKTGVELSAGYNPTPHIGLNFAMGFSRLATEKYYRANVSYFDFGIKYRILPYDVFTPVMTLGAGTITGDYANRFDLNGSYYSKISTGTGFEYLLNDAMAIRASVDYNFMLSDELDKLAQGKYNDFFWRGNLGFCYYFGKTLSAKKTNVPKKNKVKKGQF